MQRVCVRRDDPALRILLLTPPCADDITRVTPPPAGGQLPVPAPFSLRRGCRNSAPRAGSLAHLVVVGDGGFAQLAFEVQLEGEVQVALAGVEEMHHFKMEWGGGTFLSSPKECIQS